MPTDWGRGFKRLGRGATTTTTRGLKHRSLSVSETVASSPTSGVQSKLFVAVETTSPVAV